MMVEGTVAPGYESVRNLFEEKYRLGVEENSQLCAYVDGVKVVDLWGKTDSNSGFDGDSLINVFSSTKSVTAIMMAMAKDNGWLDYSDKITKHWPEFGQNGKEDITLADLMRHEAGMAQLEAPLEVNDTLPENIKKNAAGEKLAKMTPVWPENGRREYHGISRGWIANEVFRRVCPDNLTLGEFLKKNISEKLDADVHIGCNRPNFFPCKLSGMGFNLKEGLKKSFGIQSGVNVTFGQYIGLLIQVIPMIKRMKPYYTDVKEITEVCSARIRAAEMPSANGNCSARGLALLGSAMANKGQHNGTRIMSEAAWDAMHAEPTCGSIFPGIDDMFFTQGGVAKFRKEEQREGYYGWFGYGGSSFQWHPELKIGFAYTCTLLFPMSFTNLKSTEFQREIAECARKLKKS